MSQDYSATFTVDQTPEEVFAAINNVRGWWTGDIEGDTASLNDEFTYRYEDIHYSKQQITESIPGKKVAWRVIDSNLNFVADKSEWNGTEITFDIAKKGDKTEVHLMHQGLVPEIACFDNCSTAWSHYINGNLRRFITTGTAQPKAEEKAAL